MTDTRAVLAGVCDLIGEHMASIQAMRYSTSWKADGSPVTEADVWVERQIEDYLVAKLGRVTFIGEESYSPSQVSRRPWVAVLDPIDGTENFCSGLKIWGVSLSLWHEGAHAGSLLLLPELGERLMTGDRVEKVVSRLTGFSSSISDELVSQLATVGEARITGCAVYNLMNVITGVFARFVNPVGAYSWDLLAGVSLALEHGCSVEVDDAPYGGGFLEPGRRYKVDIRHN